MEVRVENTITPEMAEKFKNVLDWFFNVDFSLTIEKDYIYFNDK